MKALLLISLFLLFVVVIKKSAFANEAELLGQPAPSFDLKNSKGELVSLNSYKGQWLVLYFTQKTIPLDAPKKPAYLEIIINRFNHSTPR